MSGDPRTDVDEWALVDVWKAEIEALTLEELLASFDLTGQPTTDGEGHP